MKIQLRIILTYSLLSILSFASYGQLKKEQVKEIADSILTASAGSSLIQQIRFDEFLMNDTDDILLNKNFKEEYTRISTIYDLAQDTVIYWLRFKVGESPMLIEEKNQFPDSASFSLYFLQLNSLYLTSLPDFNLFEEYTTESARTDFISVNQAIDSADAHFPKKIKKKKGQENLVYHEEDRKTYWVITRSKGLMEVIEYSIYVDATNGTFVRMINNDYTKGLFEGK